jgi:hypothetical protein
MINVRPKSEFSSTYILQYQDTYYHIDGVVVIIVDILQVGIEAFQVMWLATLKKITQTVKTQNSELTV